MRAVKLIYSLILSQYSNSLVHQLNSFQDSWEDGCIHIHHLMSLQTGLLNASVWEPNCLQTEAFLDQGIPTVSGIPSFHNKSNLYEFQVH